MIRNKRQLTVHEWKDRIPAVFLEKTSRCFRQSSSVNCYLLVAGVAGCSRMLQEAPGGSHSHYQALKLQVKLKQNILPEM